MIQKNELCEKALDELRYCTGLTSALLNKEDELREIDIKMSLDTNESERNKLIKQKDRAVKEIMLRRSRLGRFRRAMDSLTDRQRFLLEHLYVFRTPVTSIMESLCVEKSAFYRFRRDTLTAFVRALYGVDPFDDKP
ncbi:MAG: hypothetical protein VB111_07060 [Clostridiaceae bacterium]|nr:hypothetical protein [Clostridiaceae bacterium]